MFYNLRISSAFKNAKYLEINNSSKIVIMSDVHRGIGDYSDNFSKNENIYLSALNNYYNKGYTYIELGDGDELWENSSFSSIKREHIDVFLLLKKFHEKERLHMVFGNHDIVKKKRKWCVQNFSSYFNEYSGRYAPLFRRELDITEGIILKHKDSGKNLYLLHGHQGDFFNDKLWRLSCFLVRYLWRPLELVGMENPYEPSRNATKKAFIEENLIKWAGDHNKILIAGHTHRPCFPKKGEPPYFNDGSCVRPRAINAIEITGGMLTLVEWSVYFKSDGTLYVKKKLIKEPIKIENL